MEIGDGLYRLNNEKHFWRERSKSNENSTYSDSKDSSIEVWQFRGFEKEPRVLVEKFDIESFINKTKSNFVEISPKLKLRILPQLVSDCFVRLARDDLKILKEEVLKNSRLNKSRLNGILSMPLLHCKICEKAYNSERKLQNHLENKHMLVYKTGFNRKAQKRVSFSDCVIVHEIKEYHRCRKCTKIFEEYKSLKSHMKQEHKKRKCYICHYCSKNFVDRMFFKVHIKNHCDACGLHLPNKRIYSIHRRNSCRVLKKYSCKTCQSSFFRYMDLKDHSYDHLENLFICDVCKEQHSTKCAVAHHISFLHSKRRPKQLYTNRNLGTERLYLCKFCEISSIDRDVLERHVSELPDINNRKRTGYKDYYFCDQCLKKFDTETDMLHHKWSHFLNIPKNSQVQVDDKIKEEIVSPQPPPETQITFNIHEKLPKLMQPKIVLQRVDYVEPQNRIKHMDGNSVDSEATAEEIQHDGTFEISVNVKKAIVDPKSKKTLISKFQCKKCHKYYSNKYCLNRHILSMHREYSALTCDTCEENFVWPSLLKSHKCIRANIPEMPFDDARPEIQFDNYRDFGRVGFDELMNVSDDDDYMNTVDFEIPAPVVEVTEYENRVENTNGNGLNNSNGYNTPNNSYKIVMQEVPIEF